MPDYLSVSAGDCRVDAPEEVTHMAHCQRNLLLGGLPGIEAHRAFGAEVDVSMATAYGCAGTSSGRTRSGNSQERTKSRVTVQTKSALVYMLVRKSCTRHRDVGLASAERWSPPLHVVLVGEVRHLRTESGWARRAQLRRYARAPAVTGSR